MKYNAKNAVSTFSQSPLIGSLSNLQVTRTCIKSWTSSNLGWVGLFTLELFALERFHWLWMGKWYLYLFSVTMNSVSIKLTDNEDSHEISDEFEFWSYVTSHFGVTCPWAVLKKNVSSFSQSPLIGFLSKLQVTRIGIKARMSSNLGPIRLFTLELLALARGFFFPIDL